MPTTIANAPMAERMRMQTSDLLTIHVAGKRNSSFGLE